jgi:hypothetical protein
MIETATLCSHPWSIILRPFNRAKASYSENGIGSGAGCPSLKNPKLASSAS